MGKKKPPEPKNDFACEEDLDVCSFSEEPIITGKCIAFFSFSDDKADKINEPAITLSNNNIHASELASTKTLDFNNSSINNNTIAHADTNTNDIDNFNSDIANITKRDRNSSNISTSSMSQLKTLSNNENNTLTDNRKSPIVNGCAPPIDGEYLDIKRTYMLRSSTVRKLNELKSIHPNLNTYVSTLVDLAIADYYEHIINQGGTQ
ncbi:hypothetical protein psyc5s11_33100 [Clostridium gelidum]|uniref:Uncharacterized protein n=1 Tax=Clostridium gelidum TaxID=704125 RepID=A0ABN6J241_9CLOT|nr:hypothetical protein [Clostridium gelidum]BCZ47243.1 hypothetical protein psyc5s11_33100 [Clostridium gelidum]